MSGEIGADIFERLDAFAEQVVAAGGTPGLTIGLTDRDRDLHTSGHGLADVAAGRPMTAESRGQIGSISKSFTALCLMQEVEAGRLDLHSPVTDHLPWFRIDAPQPITIHHLLTHTAGLPMGTEPAPPSLGAVALCADERAVWPAGERFWYSNTGYATVGLVLETLTGTTAAEAVRRRVLEPLGMTDTISSITYADRVRMPVGYDTLVPGRGWRPGDRLAPATWIETESADGSICSTPADMLRYIRMLLARGRDLVRPDTFAAMLAAAVPDDEGGRYGYALALNELDGRETVGHGGGMVGFHADLLLDLDAGLGVMTMVNGPTGATPVAEYALRLMRAARGGQPLPDSPEFPKPATAEPADDPPGAELAPFVGRFRSHNPWCLEIVVTARNGRLWVSGGPSESAAADRRGRPAGGCATPRDRYLSSCGSTWLSTAGTSV
jgi:CubicO group peptidase (beta-lactamase class C family)